MLLNFLKNKKPRILMLLDYKGWAFDNSAQEIAKHLNLKYDFDFIYVNDNPKPKIKPKKYDLIYVFFWGEKYHTQYNFPKHKVIKQVSSHRWVDDARFGPCSTKEMVVKYLNDASTIICTSIRLVQEINLFHNRVFHTPNGISLEKFYLKQQRIGKLNLGWAGNIKDSVKGYNDIIKPACENLYNIHVAPGDVTHTEMNEFYNQLDVLIVSSKHEGEPLTLIEAMAAGCFPVCVDVGIVPELISHKVNGYIVEERSQACFLNAFKWCETNLEFIRKAGVKNAQRMQEERGWANTVTFFDTVFQDTLNLKVKND